MQDYLLEGIGGLLSDGPRITMIDKAIHTDPIDHGDQCSCVLLARAVGLDPRKLTFAYCHRVLHKHWRMTCRHGERSGAPVAAALSEHWRNVGAVDPVKAVLISNDQRHK